MADLDQTRHKAFGPFYEFKSSFRDMVVNVGVKSLITFDNQGTKCRDGKWRFGKDFPNEVSAVIIQL